MTPFNPSADVSDLEQEAISSRFERGAFVVPLSNGTYAVFANDRTSESLVIVDYEHLHLAVMSRAGMVRRRTPSRTPGILVNIADSDELFELEELEELEDESSDKGGSP